MAMQNPRRPHLGWCDPSKFEVSGDFHDVLTAAAERAPTPEMRDNLIALAKGAVGQSAIPGPPVPVQRETRPLADGIEQQANGEFVCEPCGKTFKGYVQTHNHGMSEAHVAKVKMFLSPTSVTAPPRGSEESQALDQER